MFCPFVFEYAFQFLFKLHFSIRGNGFSFLVDVLSVKEAGPQLSPLG